MVPDTDPSGNTDRTSRSNGKLSRLIDEYQLDELGDEIEHYWLRDTGGRYSLRDLANYVNRQLLRTAVDNVGMNPLDGEVENTYRLLTDDNVSVGTRTQTQRELERAGIDVEALEADFVSRQAVHTYLTKDRDVKYTSSNDDPVTKEAATIQGLKRRLTAIIHSKLKRLRNTNKVVLGNFEVLLDVRVLCKDCGAQYQLSEFLQVQSCECSQDS